MTTTEIKKSLHHSIDTIEDESILMVLETLIKDVTSDEVVGYVGKTPLTRADVLRRELKAEKSINEGRVHTIEEVKARLLKK